MSEIAGTHNAEGVVGTPVQVTPSPTPLPLPPPPAQALPGPRIHGLSFSGKASEYFGIWITNVALTILTLGLYSAWATVRTRRYFYQHTSLAGAPFDYLADPHAILRGRIIAAGVMILLGVTSKLFTPLYVILLVAVMVATPWIIVQALRFRARYTSWRGLTFYFDGTPGQAAKTFFAYPLLAMFSFGLLYPWVMAKQQEFAIDNLRYGGTPFSFVYKLSDYVKPLLVAVAGYLVAFVPLLLLSTLFKSGEKGPGGAQGAFIVLSIIWLWLVMMAVATYVRVSLGNLLWNNSTLAEHQFESTLDPWKMLWIHLSNAVAIAGTLGLLYPWAVVRAVRYRTEQFVLIAADSMEELKGAPQNAVSPVGDELGDALGNSFDPGFGF